MWHEGAFRNFIKRHLYLLKTRDNYHCSFLIRTIRRHCRSFPSIPIFRCFYATAGENDEIETLYSAKPLKLHHSSCLVMLL